MSTTAGYYIVPLAPSGTSSRKLFQGYAFLTATILIAGFNYYCIDLDPYEAAVCFYAPLESKEKVYKIVSDISKMFPELDFFFSYDYSSGDISSLCQRVFHNGEILSTDEDVSHETNSKPYSTIYMKRNSLKMMKLHSLTIPFRKLLFSAGLLIMEDDFVIVK